MGRRWMAGVVAALIGFGIVACAEQPPETNAPVETAPVTPATTQAAPARGGLMPEQIRSVVIANTRSLHQCFRVELGDRSVALGWSIRPDGTVSTAEMVQPSGDAEFDACLVGVVRGLTFPSSTAPTKVSHYPFKFGLIRDGGGG